MKIKLFSLSCIMFVSSCATYIAEREEERTSKDPNKEPIIDKTEAIILDIKTAAGLAKIVSEEIYKNNLPPLEKSHKGSESLVCAGPNEQKICSISEGCICSSEDK